MRLSFRKALWLGPLRLNLSKRGVGASVGVKGARLGVDANGNGYAAGGRDGLYFREHLTSGAPSAPRLSVWRIAGIVVVSLIVALMVTGWILGGL
jgi:hypothetical protein